MSLFRDLILANQLKDLQLEDESSSDDEPDKLDKFDNIGENQLPVCTVVQKTLEKDKFNPDGTYALAVSSYVIFKIKKVMFKAGKKIYSSGARKRTWAEMNGRNEDEDVGGRDLPKLVNLVKPALPLWPGSPRVIKGDKCDDAQYFAPIPKNKRRAQRKPVDA
ncbi:uncharacterized protein EHS24_008063 [Apiotrichum porosum]|uniref:Uncharacterized protein n=1 Tax=Apiotrichum porosum TaxID=105984 RepID=A0A427XSU2_9TREE|nr:uncharacterized protein EHS24_008063 [Apiotrichum porosum]RSH81868.1 hypothetical protein EHS24_008063 [Apiotrichum porosum]